MFNSKIIKKTVSVIIALTCSFQVSLCCTAQDHETPEQNSAYFETAVTDEITPRAAVGVGTYTSTSDPRSFITIESNTNGNTTCLVYIVLPNTDNRAICGTGMYYYSGGYSLIMYITDWYYADTPGTVYRGSETQKVINCTYTTSQIRTQSGECYVLN